MTPKPIGWYSAFGGEIYQEAFDQGVVVTECKECEADDDTR